VPGFDSLMDQVAMLRSWSGNLPSGVGPLPPETAVSFGERHGSWFLRVVWRQDDLSRSAELALTNPEATPDGTAEVAYITVRATASTDSRFVDEILHDRRRASRGVSIEQLEAWLLSAVQRARGYTASEGLTCHEPRRVGAVFGPPEGQGGRVDRPARTTRSALPWSHRSISTIACVTTIFGIVSLFRGRPESLGGDAGPLQGASMTRPSGGNLPRATYSDPRAGSCLRLPNAKSRLSAR
jgi:hypothetical protein